MGKVKQAIQEVEQEVIEIVENHGDISLPDVQTILFKKYFHKANTGYFLDEKVVKNAYNKAVFERDEHEEYWQHLDEVL